MAKYNQVLVLHRYYKITKFYAFLKDTAFKGGIAILIFIGIILGLEYFFIDINGLLKILVETYSPQVVFIFFLLSESILGLIPPEVFIAWSAKSETPWLFLFILATMSYLGGIIAYFSGKLLFLIPAVKHYIEIKTAKHIINLRKWGGFFVLVGATLPPPHSIISLACGMIGYKFQHYLLWALFRYLRFAIYALIIFKIF